MSRTQHKVEAEGKLRPVAVLTSAIEEVLEAMLINCTPESIAYTLRGDATSSGSHPDSSGEPTCRGGPRR